MKVNVLTRPTPPAPIGGVHVSTVPTPAPMSTTLDHQRPRGRFFANKNVTIVLPAAARAPSLHQLAQS